MAAPTKVNILVKPLFRDGTDVVCAIKPVTGYEKFVEGGVIILRNEKRDEIFKLNFQIEKNTFGLKNWHSNKLSANKNGCPQVGNTDDQFNTPTLNSGSESKHVVGGPASKLVVNVAPKRPRHILHYALYFDDGHGHMCTFDPIILPDNGGTE
jgi:hypothetical protein